MEAKNASASTKKTKADTENDSIEGISPKKKKAEEDKEEKLEFEDEYEDVYGISLLINVRG